MKINLKIIQNLINFELPPVSELTKRVNSQLGGVEEIINIGERYEGARIVRVVSCEKHPNANRLSVCLIDDGGVVEGVERSDNGLVQVVCGAPNVHSNMWAAWLPPKTAVPASVGEAEPFVLDARPLRGVLSQGMLAAGDELALNDDHEGIVEITSDDMPDGVELKAGAGFAKTFGLTGCILDIENKMFTHRPDCFGQLGVAREIAGIFGHEFESPEWYKNIPKALKSAEPLALDVFNETEKSPLFTAVILDNVTVAPSPLWLQCQLVAMGGKPINNIVDITNYVMLMTAQPTHAYDYDKLRGNKLGVRLAREGEMLKLLNDKGYKLTADDVIIADGEGAIGLAGIMGGAGSEVSSETKRIVLEVANFDMYAVRKSAMRHGIFTDALTRFNKGQSPRQIPFIVGFALDSLKNLGARQASEVLRAGEFKASENKFNFELGKPLAVNVKTNPGENNIEVEVDFINQRLGYDFEPGDIAELLENVEFEVEVDGRTLHINIPFWRTDIDEPEDVVEEVGRLYGFDKLPRQLPQRSTKPAMKNPRRELKQAVRQSLSRAGANEVLTYSFVHENMLKKAEQDPGKAYRLSNALSPDLQYYRLSVLPSLLDKVHANIKAGYNEFALFEMGKGHTKNNASPIESNFTDIVYAAKQPGQGSSFYKVQRIVGQLLDDLGGDVVFRPITAPLDSPMAKPFDHARSALIETEDGIFIGIVGELKRSVIKKFKLPEYVAAASLDTSALEQIFMARKAQYQPLSRFPSTSRDISLKVSTDTPCATLYDTVKKAISTINSDINVSVQPVAIYQSGSDSLTKTITLRLRFISSERTLTDADITPIMESVTQAAAHHHSAELV